MKKKHIVLSVVLIVLIAIITTGIIVKSRLEAGLNELVSLTLQDMDLSWLPDGTYFGSYSAFPVEAEVEVTVLAHHITDIKLIKHVNGRGRPAEIITQKVVESQTLNVDLVSGATYSSKTILKAIENALVTDGK